MYISKLLENVGSVVYDYLDDSDKPSLFEITAVLSTMGEKLPLNQVCLQKGTFLFQRVYNL